MPASAYGTIGQLFHVGGLEKFLIESPSLTFWRFQHMQYTNFAVDYKQKHLDGQRQNRHVTIDREGDLLSEIYLRVDLPALAAGAHYIDSVGQLMIKQVDMTIGGQCVKSFTGNYLYCWDELSGGLKKLEEMTGKYGTVANLQRAAKTKRTVYVPLPFHASSGSALPLVALQFHNVKFNFQFEDLSKLTSSGATPKMLTAANQNKVYIGDDAFTAGNANYDAGVDLTYDHIDMQLLYGQVYLSDDERSRFADLAVEMLIGQVQQHGGNSPITGNAITSSHRLDFNHSVSEIIWAVKHATAANLHAPFGGKTLNNMDYDVLTSASLKLNSNDRWDSKHPIEYFRLVQPYQHHSNIPKAKIYCFNFGLHPEEDQPSGAINFSRIDNITFQVTADNAKAELASTAELYVFGVNYNVLVIKDGLGGLMYAS
jgi:hypothetical protein